MFMSNTASPQSTRRTPRWIRTSLILGVLCGSSGGPAAGEVSAQEPAGPQTVTAAQLQDALHDREDRYAPRPRLVSIEQTTNMGGGRVWPQEALRAVVDVATRHDMRTHLDGARTIEHLLKSFPQEGDNLLRLVFLFRELELLAFRDVRSRSEPGEAPSDSFRAQQEPSPSQPEPKPKPSPSGSSDARPEASDAPTEPLAAPPEPIRPPPEPIRRPPAGQPAQR